MKGAVKRRHVHLNCEKAYMLIKKNTPKVLICDDDQTIHLALKSVLGKEFDFRSAYNGDEALAILKKQPVDLVLLDMEIRTGREGIELVPKILDLQSNVEIIFFSGKTGFEYVRDAMKLGVYDYLPKDSGAEEIRHSFEKALEHRQLKTKTLQSQMEVKRVFHSNPLIGKSAAIEKIRKQIERARLSPAPVVIYGETGTGKEVVARLLRKGIDTDSLEPFVSVDSSTIQSSVAESMLFGHEKGAFTGADKMSRGLFEEADNGSIYFDELGNMPLEIQNKLLRVIQEKEVLRIGSTKPLFVNFRVICATNRNLEEMVGQGQFKDDLYQRINVLQITIPPLRDRKEDIPLLLEHFAETMRNGLPKITFLPETIALIEKHPLPGNVRELSNLVLHLYAMTDAQEISPLDLPIRFSQSAQTKKNQHEDKTSERTGGKRPLNFYAAVESFEREFLAAEYQYFDGNVSRMAIELGMDRSYLHSKLKNYGIHATKGK